MSEQAAVLDSPPVMEVERGPLVNMTGDQRTEFRRTGELPIPPKKEESAPSSEAKTEVKAESAGEAETPEQKQERTERKPKQTAAERIAELKATIAKIEKGAGIKTEAESSTAKPEVPQIPPTRPKPTAEDKNEDGTLKYQTYEDLIEDLTEWKAEQREAKREREKAEQERTTAARAKVAEAKSRYENFDEVVGPAVEAIVADPLVSPVVKQMMDDSDVFADLMYTIGGNKDELAKFVKMAKETPGKALRYIALTESLIAEELEAKAKPVEEPAKPRTQAPKPPSEAGGRAATPPDGLESAAKAGDFRNFKTEANRRYLAKLKG